MCKMAKKDYSTRTVAVYLQGVNCLGVVGAQLSTDECAFSTCPDLPGPVLWGVLGPVHSARECVHVVHAHMTCVISHVTCVMSHVT